MCGVTEILLEEHAEVYKLAPVSKINVVRMLMTGKAKECFDLRAADHDTTDAAKSYDKFLGR